MCLRGASVGVMMTREIFLPLTTMLETRTMKVGAGATKRGRQAIGSSRKSRKSAGLMDIMMPEMDGYQTMREIRKDAQFGALPMLALTPRR